MHSDVDSLFVTDQLFFPLQVTGPPESDSAPPAEVAEGEESPAAAQASSSSQSAEALSGAGLASELPGVHSQASQAAPAKHVSQDSSEAERTAPPAATEAASTSTPPAGKQASTLGYAEKEKEKKRLHLLASNK